MEMIISDKLRLTAEIDDEDFENVRIEGVGRAHVSYCNKRPGHTIINGIEIWKIQKEEMHALAEICRKEGIRFDKNRDVTIKLSSEQTEILVRAIEKQYEDFVNDFMNGKYKTTLMTVGCDFPHFVINVAAKWGHYYFFLGETYHLYNNSTFLQSLNKKEGEDITNEVIVKIKEMNNKKAVVATQKREKYAAMSDIEIANELFVESIHVDESGEFSDCPDSCDDCFWYKVFTKDVIGVVKNKASFFSVQGKHKSYTYYEYDENLIENIAEVKKAEIDAYRARRVQ